MSNPASPGPISIAIVGCGAIAPTQAKALAGLGEHCRLTHCCDSDHDKAVAFAAEHGLLAIEWQALLDDPTIEAVTICVPSGLHAKLGAMALKKGKHVMIEKPMDASLEACDELLAAHAAGDRVLSVISQHRFDPGSRRVRSQIDNHALGKLILVDVSIPWYRSQEYYDSGDWRGTWAMDGGGCLMNQGVHTVDLMLWLCGPVKSVFARTATAAHERIEVEDVVSASLEFANGAIGTLLASTSCYPGFLARLAIYGVDGTAILEGDELMTLAVRGQEMQTGGRGTAHALQVATGGTKSATANSSPIPAASGQGWAWGDAHRAQFVDFFECIRDDRKPVVDGRSARDAVALIKAVYESARTGLPVRL